MAISYANPSNAELLDQNYQQWRKDPASVDATWSAFFEGFELGSVALKNGGKGAGAEAAAVPAGAGGAPLQTRVDGLVYAYRTLGHTIAHLDPLTTERPENPLLSLRELGFSEKDLDLIGQQQILPRRPDDEAARNARAAFRPSTPGTSARSSCTSRTRACATGSATGSRIVPRCLRRLRTLQRQTLRTLMKVESFEHFLHTKYKGQKRFSLEGAESLLDHPQRHSARVPPKGVEEIVMGMAHRGRLSVIAEFLKKPFKIMFAEFSRTTCRTPRPVTAT
jgi:2-oxoglutarate dehydrogenase E1 component